MLKPHLMGVGGGDWWDTQQSFIGGVPPPPVQPLTSYITFLAEEVPLSIQSNLR